MWNRDHSSTGKSTGKSIVPRADTEILSRTASRKALRLEFGITTKKITDATNHLSTVILDAMTIAPSLQSAVTVE